MKNKQKTQNIKSNKVYFLFYINKKVWMIIIIKKCALRNKPEQCLYQKVNKRS